MRCGGNNGKIACESIGGMLNFQLFIGVSTTKISHNF